MSIRKIFKNQTASALVMIMAAAAAVAGAGVYIMRVSQNVEKSVRHISDREKYRGLNKLITTGLEDSIYCTSALSGKDITDAWTANGVSLTPFTMNLLGSSQLINSTWKSPEFLEIQDIRLYITEADLRTNIQRDIATSPLLNVVNAAVRISAKRGTPALEMAKNDHFNTKLLLYYEIAGAQRILYACFSAIGEGALCSLGEGVFNSYAAIGTRPRCEPFNKCLLDEQGIISTLGTCSSPYSKVRLSPTSYICQWCNQNWVP